MKGLQTGAAYGARTMESADADFTRALRHILVAVRCRATAEERDDCPGLLRVAEQHLNDGYALLMAGLDYAE
jgi:hypothetical protein